MIFPDLPKRINFEQAHTYEAPAPYELASSVQTPLRASAPLTADQWFVQQGYSIDPAAQSSRNPEESIDWLARDAWEFYTLCTAMIAWIVYWWGLHHGAW
jgi:hypothetical protein